MTTHHHAAGQRLRKCKSLEQGEGRAAEAGAATRLPPAAEAEAAGAPPATPAAPQEVASAAPRRRSDAGRRAVATASGDFMAESLSRRFGIAGGLAWLGFLTLGVVGEQASAAPRPAPLPGSAAAVVKTRLEVASEAAGTRAAGEAAPEVALPSGLRYRDVVVGGGAAPRPGDLVVISYKGYANGELFKDTSQGKPIVAIFGRRPFTAGLNAGLEEALSSMRAGGRRRVVVPPALGFGAEGAVLWPTPQASDKAGVVLPNSTLEYDLELLRVSIPPS
eukprot:scaffold2.g7305.t1